MNTLLLLFGFLIGAAARLTIAAQTADQRGVTLPLLLVETVVAGQTAAFALLLVRAGLRRLIAHLRLSNDVRATYRRSDTWTYAVFLLTLLGALGAQLIGPTMAVMIVLFALAQMTLLFRGRVRTQAPALLSSTAGLAFLFMLSGFITLIYPLVWQRVLFATLGVNSISVTVVVSGLVLFLGIGALLGVGLSRLLANWVPQLFIAAELTVAAFGLLSLSLIDAIALAVEPRGLLSRVAASFGVLVIPATLLGMTFPLLAAWVDNRQRDIGRHAHVMIAMAALGSALACVITVDVMFAFLAWSGAVRIAAGLNVAIAVLTWLYSRTRSTATSAPARDAVPARVRLPIRT